MSWDRFRSQGNSCSNSRRSADQRCTHSGRWDGAIVQLLPGTMLRTVRACPVDSGSGHGASVESTINSTGNITDHLHANSIPGDIRPALPLDSRLSAGSGVIWCYGIYQLVLCSALGTFSPCQRAAGSLKIAAHTASVADYRAEVRPWTKSSLNSDASFGNIIVLVANPINDDVTSTSPGTARSVSHLVHLVLFPHSPLAPMFPPYWALDNFDWWFSPSGLASTLLPQHLWDSSRSRSRSSSPSSSDRCQRSPSDHYWY